MQETTLESSEDQQGKDNNKQSAKISTLSEEPRPKRLLEAFKDHGTQYLRVYATGKIITEILHLRVCLYWLYVARIFIFRLF